MSEGRWQRLVGFGAVLLAAGGLAAAGGPLAGASAPAGTLQVGCGSSYTTIGAAVKAAAAGDTVQVCSGTYTEDVAVTKPLTIVGSGAVVDAANLDNGFTVSASGVTIQGFTVEHAVGEGILVAPTKGGPAVTGVSILDNTVTGNDQGNPTGAPITTSSYAACNATENVPGDCGEGIHLESVTGSTVSGNTVTGNSGGILLTDELGPVSGNLVQSNTVSDNVLDCGVTLAGHSPGAVGGVFDNRVVGNQITGNGTKGQGAGVVLATGVPSGPYGAGGAVYDNVVSGNTISGNGLAGVTIHGHATGENLSGNVVEGNQIGTNNLAGDPDFTSFGGDYLAGSTTGVLVASLSPLTVTIEGNTISSDAVAVWLGSVNGAGIIVSGLATNAFPNSGVPEMAVTS
ncbi:MAG: right-handed parallel beta-helix repeat-containing protein [Actinomycetota bacterium]|nr:right-handed parallel beta-helix repeat-containing protein [Actinomycetota bacterium]